MGKRIIKIKKFKKKGYMDVDGEVDKLFKSSNGEKKIVAMTEESKARQLYVKTNKNKFAALINRKNGSAVLLQIPTKYKSFSFEGNTYFLERGGIYSLEPKSKMIATYYEGVCLPIKHSYIKYEKHNVLLVDRNGHNVEDIETADLDPQEVKDLPKDIHGNYLENESGFIIKKILNRIAGLEFDSVIANTIFHSGLIEKIGTAGRMEKWTFLLFILMVVNLIAVICVGIATQV